MALKLICGCLLAVALLGCFALNEDNSEINKFEWAPIPQLPQSLPWQSQPQPSWPQWTPKQPPKKPSWPNQAPQQPPQPQFPQKPQQSQHPQSPQKLQQSPQPQFPQKPQQSPQPQFPQKPQQSPQPQFPQKPQQSPQPQFPQKPQQSPQPQFPQMPQQSPQPQSPQKPPQNNPQQSPLPPRKNPQQAVQPKKPQRPTEAFHSCEVAEQYKIQCGAPDIDTSHCNAINCCFDGRMCYYGKSVTLQCTKDGQFIVVVARDATLPNLDLESITMLGRDQDCNPVGTTSAFAIYQFPVTACGTVMMEEPGVIIYQNRMSSSFEVAIGQNGAITRDSSFQLICQCRYTGISVEALIIEVQLVPPPPPVAALGPLNVELRLGNGICTTKGCFEQDVAYSSFYLDSDYPVKKVLRDPVYVEIRILERTDPNLVLTLGRCWATTDPFPYSFPQWDLLIDGCPYRDDHYMTALIPVGALSGLQFPSHYRRFVFKMFTFVGTGSPSNPVNSARKHNSDPQVMVPLQVKVYIHCNTAVCQPSPANNCEPRCSRKRRDVLASVQRNSRAETTVVSSQEMIIIDPSQRI
ncbi:zona pellucida sperm-binding protein 4-like [Sander vitreus]